MKRLDETKDRKIKNVSYIKIIDKKTIKIVLNNGKEIFMQSTSDDYGYDSVIKVGTDLYD